MNVIAERSISVGVGEVVNVAAKRLPDGRLVVAFEALVMRAGEVIACGPLYDVPVESGRQLASALAQIIGELGVPPGPAHGGRTCPDTLNLNGAQ